MNKLYEIRKDLKDILEIKKKMDYHNLYNNGDSQFFKAPKDDFISEGANLIKSIIIDLGEKYKQQIKNNKFNYIEKENVSNG